MIGMAFRGMALPALALALSVGGCGGKGKAEAGGEAVASREISVKAAPIEKRLFMDKVHVQGTLESSVFANVSARVDGTIEEMYVDKGDYVEAGKSRLFTIDKANRERAVATARQNVAMARQNLNVARASMEKARVEYRKAELDKDRYERLHKSGTATDNELELYTTRFEQARAGMKYAEASEGAVAEQVKSAEIALEVAEKDLGDCTVYAPVSGVVSKRLKEPGEQGSKGGVMLRIDDTSAIEAVAYMPAKYYSRVLVNETAMRIAVDGRDAGQYRISYKSPVIDPALRTFEVRALLAGDSSRGIVPGAMADIDIVLEQREALAVPTHSIVSRRLGTLIYLPQDGKAVPCLVECGLENDGMTEIRPAEGAGLQEGTLAVTEGQSLVSDNDRIRIQE